MKPFFKLDGSNEKIHFRSPTVKDCREYCGFPVSLENSVATQYLNSLQEPEKHKTKEISDSLNWTAQDRLTALFWIYINSRDDHVITQMYNCQHCGNEHGRQLDVSQLLATISENSNPLEKKVESITDKDMFVVPLRGYAQEHIEELVDEAHQYAEGTQEYEIAMTDVRLYELAYSLKFADENSEESTRDLAKKRFEYLLSLDPYNSFQKLAIEVRQKLSTMHHGLATYYSKGQFHLYTPEHECPDKEGKTTELLLPFRSHDYLPVLSR